jgi:histidinol phosphatase-like enzyme
VISGYRALDFTDVFLESEETITLRRAVLLDRDGTLGGDGGYCHRDVFRLFPPAGPAIRLLNDTGYKVIVVTN